MPRAEASSHDDAEDTYRLHVRDDGTEVRFPQPEFKLDRFKRVIANPHELPHHSRDH